MPIVKLTPQFVASATCPEGKNRIEYVCETQPGFYLLVNATGRTASYFYRYRNSSGVLRHVHIGRAADISLSDARKQALKIRSEVTLGQDPRGDVLAQKSVMTFGTFFETMYLEHAKKFKRSWQRDEQLYRIRIKDIFGNRRLNQISKHDIMKFHADLPSQGLAPASCDHHLKLIKHVYNVAIDWEVYEGKNPASRVPLFSVDNRIENLLSDEELQRLITVLRTDSNRPICLIMLFLLSTGARLNEALQAKWSDIDMKNRVWTIPAKNSKSKRNRAAPLNDSAIDVLKQLDTSKGSVYVFVNRKTGLPFVNVSKVWHRLRDQAKLSKKMRIHDARHCTAHMMASAGRSLLDIQALLGHANYASTIRYTRLSMKTLHEASGTVSNKIGVFPQADNSNEPVASSNQPVNLPEQTQEISEKAA